MFFIRNPIFKKNFRKKNWNKEIDPDEILIDATNLPQFDQSQFEGRLEKPLSKKTIAACGVIFALILVAFAGKISILQIAQGEAYAKRSSANNLRQSAILSERGVIYDRNNILLASNTYDNASPEYPHRKYSEIPGMSHIIGYIRYPAKDSNGFYYQPNYEGIDGVEEIYNDTLAGKAGLKIIETNALGDTESESVLEPPENGESLTLSIDSRVQEKLYDLIKNTADNIGFEGGAGIILDVQTGEILTAASFPEYGSKIMSDRTNKKEINALLQSKRNPFLNRVTDGLYTPGSIIKPFVALAALKENVISPDKKILSTGSISIPNPFDPTKQNVFRDWRPQGYVDMRQAIAVSSDVYFYEIGGGFEDQIGLGIEKIEKYMRLFGFGEAIQNNLLSDKTGAIPSPAWKKENFNNEQWRVGDTYHTSIGQYGFQVTPIQAARAIASIANNGTLLNPVILKTAESEVSDKIKLSEFSDEHFRIVKEGMRLAVLEGTASGLNIPQVEVAAKTGTAELGTAKKFVNSWIIGFFPYEKPRYAFTAIMEKGPYDNTVGALYVMRQLFEWMAENTPEYLQ
jgi:penicillin-binding protein 2